MGEAVIKMHPARAGKHCFSFWCSVIQTCDLIKPSANPRAQAVSAGQRDFLLEKTKNQDTIYQYVFRVYQGNNIMSNTRTFL